MAGPMPFLIIFGRAIVKYQVDYTFNMKFPILIFGTMATIFSACQSNKKADKSIDSASKAVVTSIKSTKECYSFVKDKDSAALSMDYSGTNVTGTLSYNLYEKDKNNGTIAGIIKGDTIIADYTFNAEGTKSVRQVAFIKRGGRLLEGFAEVEEIDGKVNFKDLKSLKFDSKNLAFDQVNCN